MFFLAKNIPFPTNFRKPKRCNSFIQCPANGSRNFHPFSQRQKVYRNCSSSIFPRFPHVLLSLVQQQSIPKARSDNFTTTGLLKYVPSLKTNISQKKATSSKGIVHPATIDFQGTFVSFPGGVGLLKLVSWLFQETCARLLEKTMVDYSSSLRPINV